MRNKLAFIKGLRLAGFAEAGSWLALLAIAMPLKYLAGKPETVRVVGWIHGLLFIVYIVLLLVAKLRWRWPLKKAVYGALAAFLPFGTLVFDKQLRKEEHSAEAVIIQP